MNARKYQTSHDGSIEYLDREWFIRKLVDKYYCEAAGNNAEDDKDALDLAEAHEMRLRAMDDEQLAQEYDDNIGDPRME